MPSPSSSFRFVNLASNTVALKDGRTGQARQSVTNDSGRIVQTIAKVEVDPPDSPARDWIHVEPEETTTVKVGSTVHYDVIVKVPKGKTLDEPICRATVVTDALNFRRGPGTEYERLGDPFSTGTVLRVTGRLADFRWVQIVDNSQLGWIAVSGGEVYSELSGDCRSVPIVAPPPTSTPTFTPTFTPGIGSFVFPRITVTPTSRPLQPVDGR